MAVDGTAHAIAQLPKPLDDRAIDIEKHSARACEAQQRQERKQPRVIINKIFEKAVLSTSVFLYVSKDAFGGRDKLDGRILRIEQSPANSRCRRELRFADVENV